MNVVGKFTGIIVEIAIFTAIIFISMQFVAEAKASKAATMETERAYMQAREEREWNRSAGMVNGADVIDFITAHIGGSEIYIVDDALRTDTELAPAMAGGKLDVGALPDMAYDTTFLFDRVVKGNSYEAVLMRNNGNIIGITYTRS